ncbi:MAG: ATP-binding protein [Actinomycetota bacterium]|nr:ATP-binding protein [Actinomycetota bacterium]
MDRIAGGPRESRTLGEIVELRVGATLTQLPLVRSFAGTIAMREDYDVDAIADLKLAVDEACTILVKRALPWSTLSCRFTVGGSGIRFSCSVPVLDTTPIDQRSLGWAMLMALVESVSTTVTPDGHTEHSAEDGLTELVIDLLVPTKGQA